MQAIYTKYLPPTNTRGSRIKAVCDRGSISIPYPHRLAHDDVHPAAAQALCDKFIAEDRKQYGDKCNGAPWNWTRVVGGLPGEMGYAHVFVQPN